MSKRVFIVTDRLGRGSDELGGILMKSFIYSLARNETKPVAVMLMNEGVRLACEGSSSLDDLKLLSEAGVPVKACGTCLDFLGLSDKLVVGEVGNMADAVAALLADDALTVG
jgi:selenium metabolism protein YedF